MYVIECNHHTYEVHESTIVKLNLLSDSVKCSELANEIAYWNDFYRIYSKCLGKYSKRLLSKREFETFIGKEVSNSELVDAILLELARNNIINDQYYQKIYVETYLDNKKYSSNKVEQKLFELGIVLSDENKSVLVELDYDKALKIVDDFNNKKSVNSKVELRNKCIAKLKSYYYSDEVIYDVVKNLEYDDTQSLKKAYLKLSKRYDQSTIIKKLYAKGYKYEDILAIKEEEDD